MEGEAPHCFPQQFCGGAGLGCFKLKCKGFSVLLPNRAVKTWPRGYPSCLACPVMLLSKPAACMAVWKDQRSLPAPCAN